MWRLLAVLVLLPNLSLADGAKQGIADPNATARKAIDYYCTDTYGQRRELGEVVCITAGSCQQMLAKCDMSLNNPMWRKIQDGCPAVSLEPTPFDRLRDMLPQQSRVQHQVQAG